MLSLRLNLHALSKVGAKGMWQFMDETGKHYLTLDDHVDERYSPVKATKAAALLFKANYKRLKSWPLAVTAYNHGAGGLRRAVRRLKTKSITTIIEKHRGGGFGFASKNFYSEFLAALYVTVYHERLLGQVKMERPVNLSGVKIEQDMFVPDLSEACGLELDELSFINPDLSKDLISGKLKINKGYIVKLPEEASKKLKEYFLRVSDEVTYANGATVERLSTTKDI